MLPAKKVRLTARERAAAAYNVLTLERNIIASNQSVFQATAALTADREVRADTGHRTAGAPPVTSKRCSSLRAVVICNKGYHSFITYVTVTEEPQRSGLTSVPLGLKATGRSERRSRMSCQRQRRAEPSRVEPPVTTRTPLRSFDSEVRARRGHAQPAAPRQTHHITSMARKIQISKHEHTLQQHMTTSRQIRAKKGI